MIFEEDDEKEDDTLTPQSIYKRLLLKTLRSLCITRVFALNVRIMDHGRWAATRRTTRV